MAIKLLKQNLEYFKYTNNIIKSSEIDDRFNDIVNYLNDEIIFKLNNLNDNIIIGSITQTDINSILKSKSDVGYYWKKIDNDDFADNSIGINKFNYSNITNSIFISDSNGDIKQLRNSDIINFTIIKNNLGVNFDRIDNNYINPTTKITGNKINFNSIVENNLINIIPEVLDNTIINVHFKDGSIISSKILNDSVVLDNFSNTVVELLTRKIWKSIIPLDFINLNSAGNRNNIINGYWDRNFLFKLFYTTGPIGHDKLKPYIVSKNKFNNFYVKNIIKYYNKNATITDLSLIDPNGNLVGAEKRYSLSSNLFQPNSINANRLICWFNKLNNNNAHNINNILAKQSIDINHLTPAIQAKLV